MRSKELGRNATRTGGYRSRKGFTLIELLVVISIIALLASILLPSLSRAREMAKGASCLSNLHNIGISLHLYTQDNSGYFPSSYSYIDGNSGSSGYYHWTAALSSEDYMAGVTSGRFPKSANQFVCPSHTGGGWAPSNFTARRVANPPSGQVSQDPTGTIDDKQAPRLSYVANEILMPRKKYSAAHDFSSPPGTGNLRLVDVDEVEAADNTILLGEFSSSANCIWGSSVGGGAAYKSHRPTNGVKSSQANGVFDGEGYTLGTQVFKLTYDEAMNAIDAVLADKAAATTSHHISYINPNTHKTGSNYVFADGHAAKFTLKETLDPDNYMWGRKVYSCIDHPVIQDNP
jgi:prepilin-type N-terminal cleavage/methylation domain-containing protein/prepilin-type processing-associated H-X9-DG protein